MRLPLATLASGLLLANACVEEDAAMFIEGALPAVAPACDVNANQINFRSSGVLDLAAPGVGGYTAFLKVRTNLPATFNNQNVQQDITRSPNYQNYGPVDNNVVTFQTAQLAFSLNSDPDTIAALAGGLDGVGAGQLLCSGGTCATDQEEEVPAAGVVFNVQTTLNAPTVVVAELISSTTAQALSQAYRQAQLDEGLLIADATGPINIGGATFRIDDAKGAELGNRNLLALPSQRQRLNVEVSLVGETTGSVDLRPVKSAVFPFGIDICFGCIQPDAAFCSLYDAEPEDASGVTCVPGQDTLTATCVCPTGTALVNNICE